jgi:hypothetical protein
MKNSGFSAVHCIGDEINLSMITNRGRVLLILAFFRPVSNFYLSKIAPPCLQPISRGCRSTVGGAPVPPSTCFSGRPGTSRRTQSKPSAHWPLRLSLTGCQAQLLVPYYNQPAAQSHHDDDARRWPLGPRPEGSPAGHCSSWSTSTRTVTPCRDPAAVTPAGRLDSGKPSDMSHGGRLGPGHCAAAGPAPAAAAAIIGSPGRGRPRAC